MKLLIVKFGGEQIEKECQTFEFRTNWCENWIEFDHDKNSIIHNVATIKAIEEENQRG